MQIETILQTFIMRTLIIELDKLEGTEKLNFLVPSINSSSFVIGQVLPF